jgi:hypothetical protein
MQTNIMCMFWLLILNIKFDHNNLLNHFFYNKISAEEI